MTAAKFRFSARVLWERLKGLGQRTLRVRRSAPKSLRLRDSLPLGERRFVAVVECEQERFLIGGTSSSVVLLSRLAEARAMSHGETQNEVPNEEEVQTPLNALWSGGAARKRRSEPC
jgi:flagellar biogenesis protein FliO